MSRPLIISDDAEDDLREASAWYEPQREGLGDEFMLCIEHRLERVRRQPDHAEQPLPGVHRVLVRRFPYAVFYVVEPDFIKDLAVDHTSRDPRGWQQRTS